MLKKLTTGLRTIAYAFGMLAYVVATGAVTLLLFNAGNWFLAILAAPVLLFVGRLILARIENKAFDRLRAASPRPSQG